MMKSFFKKLAFVMALAMVVSMVAPAGSVFAATTGVAHQTSKEVVTAYEFEKAGDTVDFCFLGAPSDWKSTFKWETSDPAVATVDKAGIVTAVAAGTATITITAGADASYKETVVVTVPAAIEFTAAQKNTTDVVLTFNEGVDLSAVVADDFVVTAIDETFEYTLFANEVKVDKNVATLNFVEGVLSDGAVLKIAYAEHEETVVASNGDAVSAAIKYGMNSKKFEGDAYVYTDIDPDYVYLAYNLYDANGIDVTANYKEEDFDNLEWSVVNGDKIASIDYDSEKEMDVVCFEEKGAATVQLAITFVDEDGNEDVISTQTPIVAKDRPAIAFTFNTAGMYLPEDHEDVVNAVASFNKADGTIWSKNWPTAGLTVEDTMWFAASVTDNRGDSIITTKLSYEDGIVTGDTEYEEYGYFVYSSSNDAVVDIDEDGMLTAIKPGSATILVSFVAYDEDGEELAAKKVGSKRITVAAKSYAVSYGLTVDNTTLTTTAGSVSSNVYLQVFDQFGNAMGNWADWWYGEQTSNVLTDAITITATSDNYETITGYFVENNEFAVLDAEGNEVEEDGETVTMEGYVPTWPSATGWTAAYPITFYGDDFTALVKPGKYATFKFEVELDKEMSDDFEKVTSKADKAYVKVYNVDDYYEDLVDFYAGNTSVEVTKNYSVYLNKSSIDVWTDMRSEFGDPDKTYTNPVKSAYVSVSLVSGAGKYLTGLPSAYFKEVPKDAKGKYVNIKDVENASQGAIYYTITTPTKEQNNVTISKTGSVSFTFNTVTNGALKTADLGNYTVTLYSVNSRNKLAKLDTKTITVGSSMPDVTFEGFKEGNVYDGEIGWGTIYEALPELCEFKWNGTKLSDDWADFSIAAIRGTAADGKFRIKEIDFRIPVYTTETTEDGHNTYSGVDFIYTLKRNITIYGE